MWTRRELQSLLKVCGRTIDRLVARGKFPAPIRVGRSRRWRDGDVRSFMDGRG
jgi:predicted DNA-binding transcriptional regulator AlpA